MKKHKKTELIKQLKKMPIIEMACKRTGISRATYYRWRAEDEEFTKEAEEAIQEGEEMLLDLGETQLVSLVREKNWPALRFFLQSRHPKYSPKLAIEAEVKTKTRLSDDQEEMISKALTLAGVESKESKDNKSDN